MGKRDRTIAYWHPRVGRGRATVAVTRYARRWGIAWCSPKDQFSRAKGRRLALYRLTQCLSQDMLDVEKDATAADRLRAALAQGIAHGAPGWARGGPLVELREPGTIHPSSPPVDLGDPPWASKKNRGELIWLAERERLLRRQADIQYKRAQQEREELRRRLHEVAEGGQEKVAKECQEMARLAIDDAVGRIVHGPLNVYGCEGCVFAPETSQYGPWPAACRHPLSGNLAIDRHADEAPVDCPLRQIANEIASTKTAAKAQAPTTTSMIPVKWLQAMDGKLKANVHKGGKGDWKNEELLFFASKLTEEVAELMRAVRWHATRGEVMAEAADVANVALMLADSYDWNMPGDDGLRLHKFRPDRDELAELSERVAGCCDCPMAPAEHDTASLCRYKFDAGVIKVDRTDKTRPRFCPLGPRPLQRYDGMQHLEPRDK